jgi:hypothetical protein
MAKPWKISADRQRLIADPLSWVNVTGSAFIQAYSDHVTHYPLYHAALVLLGTTWREL